MQIKSRIWLLPVPALSQFIKKTLLLLQKLNIGSKVEPLTKVLTAALTSHQSKLSKRFTVSSQVKALLTIDFYELQNNAIGALALINAILQLLILVYLS